MTIELRRILAGLERVRDQITRVETALMSAPLAMDRDHLADRLERLHRAEYGLENRLQFELAGGQPCTS